jgi:hypothetical protein
MAKEAKSFDVLIAFHLIKNPQRLNLKFYFTWAVAISYLQGIQQSIKQFANFEKNKNFFSQNVKIDIFWFPYIFWIRSRRIAFQKPSR